MPQPPPQAAAPATAARAAKARPRRHRSHALVHFKRKGLASGAKSLKARILEKVADDAAPDATLEIIDVDTGIPVESCRFLRADKVGKMLDLDNSGGDLTVDSVAEQRGSNEYKALKGRKHPFRTKRRKAPGWARRLKDEDGNELIEMQRSRVLKLQKLEDGSVIPAETEQVDVTAMGEVRQRVKWKVGRGNALKGEIAQ